MPSIQSTELLENARDKLRGGENLYWIVGGAGSGKSTICSILNQKYDLPLYDMDAKIYGSFHGRFEARRHPANSAWSAAENSLQWLLTKSWTDFDAFNRAALPEYLDLLAEDIANANPDSGMLINGGICNPGLLTQVLSADQIVCVAAPPDPSQCIWDSDGARSDMKTFVHQLDEPENAWTRFLEFDRNITRTILAECKAAKIKVVTRQPHTPPQETAECVAEILNLG